MTVKHRLNDNHPDAETYAHLHALNREMPDFVWRIMLAYRPKLPATQWAAVREFTLATAISMRPDSYDETRRLMSMTGRFHAWLWASTGTAMTVEKVYTQNSIDRFLHERLSAHSKIYRWGVARQLVAVGVAATEAVLRGLPFPGMPSRAPFAPAQIATMHSWANSLTTVKKRQNAHALLGLAGGAGLRSEEIVEVCVSDIDVVDGRVFVNVAGARARRVPVRHAWARVLLRSIEGRTSPSDYAFRGPRMEEYLPRVIQTFLTDHPAQVRPTVSRLRASWIVHHLNSGVPTQIVKVAGGFRSYASLMKYLEHARTLDSTDFTGLLIGEELAR